jgi:nucleotide-binding universal stress UspA family protein
MAIKDILVHLGSNDARSPTTTFALSLAAQLGAHITAAGVALKYMPLGAIEDVGVYEAFAQRTGESREAAEAAYKKLEAALPAGVRSELVMIEEVELIASERFGELGRHFDLSIVGQQNQDSDEENALMVRGALYGSGKPIFIVPRNHIGAARIQKAMVCWDGSVAAARALAGSLPLLQRASKVEVVRAKEDGQSLDELPGFNITRHLARHGIHSTLKILGPTSDPAAAIQSYASESEPDYIVMGGYGHWRFREFVFGGVTRTLLSSTNRPLFMAH